MNHEWLLVDVFQNKRKLGDGQIPWVGGMHHCVMGQICFLGNKHDHIIFGHSV